LKRDGRSPGIMVDSEDAVEEVDHITLCPGCGNEEGHEILRTTERGSGVDHLVRCEGCSKVHTVMVRPPKGVSVNFTLSEGADSRRASIEVDGDERFTTGDVFEHDHAEWEITRLEMDDATSLKTAAASDINVVWAVRKDRVRVKMTFTDADYSFSDSIICEPDQEFHCGNMFVHEGKEWRIRALHTGQGRRLTGKLAASRIRRIFLHKPQSEWELEERERRERGRWRGQEFEGREEHQQRIRDSNFNRYPEE
jgi:uncharacterized Zn finger protein